VHNNWYQEASVIYQHPEPQLGRVSGLNGVTETESCLGVKMELLELLKLVNLRLLKLHFEKIFQFNLNTFLVSEIEVCMITNPSFILTWDLFGSEFFG